LNSDPLNLALTGKPELCLHILPALHEFYFKGVTEYLEDLVAFIDAPQLDYMNITFFNQIDFHCPRLVQFINCTPKIRALDEAHVQFGYSSASVTLRYWTSELGFDDRLINISCSGQDLQLSSVTQVCSLSLPPLSTVEDLYIENECSELVWVWNNESNEDNTLWLELLLPFTAVKNLYLSEEFATDIAAALQELVGPGITQVLPSLQNIFVEELQVEPSGPLQENIRQFSGARRQSGHPIAISVWD
jgi:hypothetical protein